MTLKRLALVGPSGTAVTQPNSGASRVIVSGGSSIVYDDAYGAKLITVSGQPTVIDLDLETDGKIFGFSAELKTPLDTPASGQFAMLQGLSLSGSLSFEIGFSSAKKIVLAGPGGVYALLSKTGSNADGTIDNGTSFRIAAAVEVGSATNNGKFSAHLYTPGSSTPLFSPNPLTTLNLGTSDVHSLRLGNGSFGSARTYGGRYLQVDNGATAEPPEWIPGTVLGTVNNVVVSGVSPGAPGAATGKLIVTWDAVANAVSYEVQYAAGADATSGWTTISNAVSGTEISGLSAGAYTIRVRAKA